ncbi:MAG: copper resistance protein CopC [Salinisphaera sp.]|nr:copper resistance protein CopC [Salinisphaera sp.]
MESSMVGTGRQSLAGGVLNPLKTVLALCLLSLLGLQSAPALAHAMLVKAEPARRAMLTATPSQVRLWFNEEIEKDYASLVLLDADKTPVTEAKPHIAPDDPKAMVLPLSELAAGKYTVKFRVLSVDGHVVDSSYDFTVKSKAQQK